MITAKDVLDVFPGATIVEEPKRKLCSHCCQRMRQQLNIEGAMELAVHFLRIR